MKYFAGIDIGSISVGIAILNNHKNIVYTSSSPHEGRVTETLKQMLTVAPQLGITGITRTTSAPDIIEGADSEDSIVAAVKAALHFHKKFSALLIAGGEKTGLVIFDGKMNYLNFRANSSCAAGTGSFLDQQARRLNLTGIEQFCETAISNTGGIPAIASRCAVFAKTDLIHAQQEGFSPAQICDGLAGGLAGNIADSLFSNLPLNGPVVFAGGVSLNKPVAAHLKSIIKQEIITDENSHLYGAIGAALSAIEKYEALPSADETFLPADIKISRQRSEDRGEKYPPLALTLSDYPSFDSLKKYIFTPDISMCPPVECDIYADIKDHGSLKVYIGLDIGSTSTKGVLVSAETGAALAGFYTRTSGRPIDAARGIFEAVSSAESDLNVSFEITGASTTGSGRRFIGGIIGADLMLDEISAHARAAYSLDPKVDTIIEIGGQDAKFTTMEDGMVTFSTMNSVCAAGTGSFIEEQAARLNTPLAAYSDLAENIEAPMASDRCTVFMERDVSYLLSEGCTVREALASVLHSVRENYLTKVAVEKNIGERIFFQGATAKNRALVAAFEQRLGRPIMVSPFCHLTGALGAALTLRDSGNTATSFRGLGIYKNEIPVNNETCSLCANSCKIKSVVINGETEAFGFLCGRDYDTQKFVKDESGALNFIAARNRMFTRGLSDSTEPEAGPTVGIPAALYMTEESPMWKKFFSLLSIRTVSGENLKNSVKTGKSLTGAEFCSPIAALHGQVKQLSETADYVFLPFYLEEKSAGKRARRQYCYYSQYVPALVSDTGGLDNKKLIMPVLKSILGKNHGKYQLYRSLKKIFPALTLYKVSSAYEKALDWHRSITEAGISVYKKETAKDDDIHVVLTGRPYTILSDSMNSGIPKIFARNGIKVFYQEMLPAEGADLSGIKEMLGAFHWHYASRIMETAEIVSSIDKAYPVLVTSFKCSPDSFAVEYFKKIMNAKGKPYLILQLDEHDSSIGYETRIEAAVRAFRNHNASAKKSTPAASDIRESALPPFPHVSSSKSVLKGKTLLMPNWDNISCALTAANLRAEGVDARLLDETTETIRKSMRLNTGQCIPLNAIAQGCADHIKNHGLDPENTALWLFDANISCNIRMFPYYAKTLLETYGGGLEKVQVYLGEMSFLDFPVQTIINGYFANMFGGMLRKAACGIRPYEIVKGETDLAVAKAVVKLSSAFEKRIPFEPVLEEIVADLKKIKIRKHKRPLAAIFGDIYARYNDVFNQQLVKTIEDNGGEVIITPQSELMKIIADPYIKKWFIEGSYSEAATAKVMQGIVPLMEKKYKKIFSPLFNEAEHSLPEPAEKILSRFGLNPRHTGESMENLLKIYSIVSHYPDIAVFVQTNPAFCCPSLVTQSMSEKIEQLTGVPVVTIEYDGTGAPKNGAVIPYLKFSDRTVKAQGEKNVI